MGRNLEPNGDMWATADESREYIIVVYKRAGMHSDSTIEALGLDAVGRVPCWPDERSQVTLHRLLVHVIAEIHRHAGHADIVRELIDGAVGRQPGNDNMAPGCSVTDPGAPESAEPLSLRASLAEQFDQLLAAVDAWMLPVLPIAAPPHVETSTPIDVDGEPRDYWQKFTANSFPFNVSGQPATTLRIGLSSDGLPVRVQHRSHSAGSLTKPFDPIRFVALVGELIQSHRRKLSGRQAGAFGQRC